EGVCVTFSLSSSFHEIEEGYQHIDPVPEDVPPPEQCPKLGEVLFKASGRPISFWEREWGALDVRYVGDSRPGGVLANARHPARARVWVRADGALPDDRRLHQAALAYASDLTVASASRGRHGGV